MLIRYLHYKFYIISYFLFNIFIFCNDKYVSDWGYFSIENKSSTIENQEIIDVVNEHIIYMNNLLYNHIIYEQEIIHSSYYYNHVNSSLLKPIICF